MARRIGSCILALCCLVMANRSASGRVVPDWDYDVLVERSDFIVIATPTSRETLDLDPTTLEPWESELRRMQSESPEIEQLLRQIIKSQMVVEISTFHVDATLKGTVKDGQVKVYHFTWKKRTFEPNKPEWDNRPILFTEGLVDDETTPPEEPPIRQYILFLNPREDGMYDPITGQYDSKYSIKHVEQR